MNRSPKPSDYRPLRSSIDGARGRAKVLDASLAGAQATLRAELARLIAPDHDEARHKEAVRAARREVAAVETERRDLLGRADALEATLPDKTARADAEKRARAAGKEAEQLNRQLNAAWASLREALAPAEAVAREVNRLRDAARRPTLAVVELSARFGLDVAVAVPPRQTGARLVAARGLYVTETEYDGGPRDIVVRELDRRCRPRRRTRRGSRRRGFLQRAARRGP